MPSYTGTLRCSHCWSEGHNKRGCPRLTTEIAKNYQAQMRLAEQYRNGDLSSRANTVVDQEWNINYHEERAGNFRMEYLKRMKIDLATGKKVTNKAAKAERMKSVTCGYCKQKGHTRRVCPVVKQDYAVYKHLSDKTRKDIYAKLRELHVNIGSLVFVKRYHNGAYARRPYLVTAFDLSCVDFHNREGACIKLVEAAAGNTHHLSLEQLERAIEQGCAHVSATPLSLNLSALSAVKTIKEAFSTDNDRPYAYHEGYNDAVTEAREALAQVSVES